jgi:CHRD domain-containing protein
MKRFSILLAALVLVSSCSNDNPTTPATDDTHVQFKATLVPANERPTPITGPESTASGAATIDFNLTRDSAGAITAANANFRVDVTGLTPTSGITASHIHTGDANTAGGVLVNTGVNPGEITLTNGAVTYSRLNITMTPAIAQSIINNPAGFYFNVHTSLNPTGVMRGQLVKQ